MTEQILVPPHNVLTLPSRRREQWDVWVIDIITHYPLILGNNLDGTTADGELNTIHSLKGLGIHAVCVRKKGKTAFSCEKQAVNYALRILL